ncbi:fatty acid desaturase [Dunaliella salina]|uniref:Fatty acid desaturase n=1 Tax=Dunaliella salina TaxID=3046 RepID=A0ABQ7GX83_DUNSA|nr:fatty acid desaturase [Dunaliella salina]|eukprot:KAF5839218.1 fatty acid desaturase [Dunaliella salina]
MASPCTCSGHQSFSNSKVLNNFVGNIVHSTILVPYHGWRISHRNHHANHGHVENDESWHPTRKSVYDEMDHLGRIGRLTLPWSMLAYPFYLWKRSPGKTGSHYDPNCDLFVTKTEKEQCITSNVFLIAWLGVLAACTAQLGIPAMLNLYVMPYWFFVVWLDVVTYLQHHGSHDPEEKLPWFRGEEWSYLRGGLTTLDRDYGIFSRIHHSIGIHVVHHLFPQIPHYRLETATEAVKPVMGPYYREPVKSGPFPTHLLEPLVRSFQNDHYVDDEGDIVYYKRDPNLNQVKPGL